jgi:thymidylate synthase
MQAKRIPSKLPTLNINKELSNLEDILNLTIDNFELVNYSPQSKIEYKLSAGLKIS